MKTLTVSIHLTEEEASALAEMLDVLTEKKGYDDYLQLTQSGADVSCAIHMSSASNSILATLRTKGFWGKSTSYPK